MGLLDTIRELVGFKRKTESPFICIRCGEGFDRNYHECPDCGAPYVVPREGAGQSIDDP